MLTDVKNFSKPESQRGTLDTFEYAEGAMLVLSRKAGQRIAIGNDITVIVLECTSGRVRIGIEAPPDVPIYREEIERISRETGARWVN